jgi:hypothetical protein
MHSFTCWSTASKQKPEILSVAGFSCGWVTLSFKAGLLQMIIIFATTN